MLDRRNLETHLLAPATGKAVPVLRGQVLTVTQIADGQCLDLNAYNLHDPREHFHSGRTRGLSGVNPACGTHLWSASPRERPMLTIIEDSVGSNDVNYSRCSAFLYEFHYGFDGAVAHSNCHDAFAEAVREWGLQTDDVHDSFNGFMNTRIVNGRLGIDRMLAHKGDRLTFLAQIDTLAVAVCCGGDLGATNNYELKGLEIGVWEGTSADHASLVDTRFTHQRSPATAGRGLRQDPAYVPEWPWAASVDERAELSIDLDAGELARLREMRDRGKFADFSDENFLRFVFFQWLERNHRRVRL